MVKQGLCKSNRGWCGRAVHAADLTLGAPVLRNQLAAISMSSVASLKSRLSISCKKNINASYPGRSQLPYRCRTPAILSQTLYQAQNAASSQERHNQTKL